MEIPKSATLATRLSSSKMLLGFTSRCITGGSYTSDTPDFRYQLPMRFKSFRYTRCCSVKEGVESSLDWGVKSYRKGMEVIQSLGYVHSNLKPFVPIQVLPCIFGCKNNIATIAFVTYVEHKMLCSFRIRNWEGICKNLLWHNLFFKDINLGTVSYVV